MERSIKLPKTFHEKETSKRLIVVLEYANLELGKVGKSKGARSVLLNYDDHAKLIGRMGANPADYRPDITHQCLLTLFDSPLNKAGLLQVYIHTRKNVLIEIHPQTRIPRTFSRFSGLMIQLLEKLSIRSSSGNEKLFNIIKNPITDHLPTRALRVGLSGDAPVVSLRTYLQENLKPSVTSSSGTVEAQEVPVVIFIGAMAHGQDDFPVADTRIGISQYPLSASVACGKVCCAFEDMWNIL